MKEIVNLDSLMNGALNERYNTEIKKILENIYDPNTDPKVKRSITLTLTLAPNQNRDAAEMECNVKVKLAPPVPVKQTVFITQNDDGSVHALENNGQLPGQVDMYGHVNQPGEATLGADTEIPDVVEFRRSKEG